MFGKSRRNDGDLTIGSVSKATGCNIETIRYYERIDLVRHPPRSSGGHRLYSSDHVKELVFVLRCRELGFSINEIRSLLRLSEGHDGSCAEVKTIAIDHAENVRKKIEDLQKMEQKLRNVGAIAAPSRSVILSKPCSAMRRNRA